MGWPVVTVASGGMAVVDVTATTGRGSPVTEATNGFGSPITKVTSGGMPVAYETIGAGSTNTNWNPSDKTANVALTNNNLTATITSGSGGVRAVKGVNSGKYYFEVTMTTWVNNNSGPGIALSTAALPWLNTASGVAYVTFGGSVYVNGTGVVAIGASASGQVIGVAVDFAAQLIWFRKAPAGNWDNNAAHNPATGAGGYSIAAMSGLFYPAVNFVGAGAEAGTANFGNSAFSGAVPSGFIPGWPI